MHFYCPKCSKTYPLNTFEYQCECGGLFSFTNPNNEKIPVTVSLGEIETPVLERELHGINMHLKLDYYMPTGSFKDRGAFTTVNAMKHLGITEVVEDSSGNAGAAFAGYCAAAGIKCHIYLPASTSPGKIKQIAAYGADVVKVEGTRDDVSNAILSAAKNTYYASHVYNPLFFEGTKSLAHEIAKQIGIPDYIVVPAGNGTMLLGVYIGFKELGKLPKIIAVQSANCAPVYSKYHSQSVKEATPTVAEGIAVGKPMRIDEMIAAVRESDGEFITVDDSSVESMQHELAEMGIYIEPTSGAAVAGALKYFSDKKDIQNKKIIVPLTGSGLKKG